MNKTSTKKFIAKILLTALLAFSANLAFAQLVGGTTYPINGTDNGITSFASLRSAITYLTANGVTGTGNVVLEFTSPYNSTSVDAPASGATKITIPNITNGLGTSATLGLTIRPAAGFTTSLTTSLDGAGIIELDGAKYITIDGRQGGAGTTIGLTIDNTNASTTAATNTSAIRLTNDAVSNNINYVNLNSSVSGSTNATLIFSTSGGTLGNSNNTISNCLFSSSGGGATTQILSTGTNTVLNTSNSISNNNITSFTANGIVLLSTGLGNGWTVSGNSIYSTFSSTYDVRLIYFGAGFGHSISNNFLGGTLKECGGPALACRGLVAIDVSPSAPFGATSTIQNNKISNISANYDQVLTRATLAFSLISATGNVGIKNNTLGDQNSTDNIIFKTSGATTNNFAISAYGIAVSATGTVADISNNNIGGITFNPTVGVTTGANASNILIARPIFAARFLASLTISNNIIGGNNANSIRSLGTARVVQLNGAVINYAGASISNNIIRNFSTNASYGFNGISVADIDNATNLNIEKNKILFDGSSVDPGGPITGLTFILKTGETFRIVNNIISLTNINATAAASSTVYGMQNAINGGIGGNQANNGELYFNTVNITGSTPNITANIYSTVSTTTPLTITNNIYSNNTPNGLIYRNVSGTNNWTSDYNTFALPASATAGTTTGNDANSIAFNYGAATYPASPAAFFQDIPNGLLLVKSTYDNLFFQKGTPAGSITTDIANNARNATTPSIGAYEIDAIVLPVKLISFTAGVSTDKVNLKWNVGLEDKVSKYEVERSLTKDGFTKVATVSANGAANYGTVDVSPLTGVSYYRLKIIDTDGAFAYSEIVSVKFSGLNNKSVSVYPNPITGSSVNVAMNNYPVGKYSYKIVSTAGSTMQKGDLNNTGENLSISLNSSLSSGVYILYISNGKDVVQSKLIKQ